MRNDNLKGWFTENKMAIKQFAQKTPSTASNEWSENWVCPFCVMSSRAQWSTGFFSGAHQEKTHAVVIGIFFIISP